MCLRTCASDDDDDDNVTIDAFHVCSETNDINKKIKLLRIFRDDWRTEEVEFY